MIESEHKKTAVIGANSLAGRYFLKAYNLIYPDSIGTYHNGNEPHLDLFKPEIASLKLKKAGYTDVIIAAAITNIGKCEREKEYTYARNVKGMLELIRQLARDNLKPIFLSSNWVFDGIKGGYDENSATNPVNEYGNQKVEVEELMPEICKGNYLIIRLSKIITACKGSKSFLGEIASHLLSGEKVWAAVDQVFCPTLVNDIVKAVIKLQAVNATGIIHVCSPEVWSKFDLAREIALACKVDKNMVKPIKLDELGDDICRPKHTNMVCRRLHEITLVKFESVSACIQQVANSYLNP